MQCDVEHGNLWRLVSSEMVQMCAKCILASAMWGNSETIVAESVSGRTK